MAGQKETMVEVKGAIVDVEKKPHHVSFDVKEVDVTLKERQAAFAVWLAEPEDIRVPGTMQELAKMLGVTEVTLWRWSKRPDVQMAVRYLILQNMAHPARVSSILDMYYEFTEDTNLPAKIRMAAGEKYLDAVGLKDVFASGGGPELLNAGSADLDLSAVPTEDLRKMLSSGEA